MKNNIAIFKLTSNPQLAEQVAERLGIELGTSYVKEFADGELMARTPDNVRGKNVYIIQSTCRPATEKLMELLIFIDGIRNAKANTINLVIPYYGFARQDRIAKAGEPITAKLVADLLGTVGVNRIITLDLHTPQIQGFFSCPVDDLSPIPLFGQYFRDYLSNNGINTSDVVVVSPDHGSLHRARDLASEIPDSTIAVIDKRRPAPNVAEAVNIVGDVKGKYCIIIDDIIDTAGTLAASSDMLMSNGAKSIMVACTHAVLSKGSEQVLAKPCISKVVSTNSIEQKHDKLEVLSVADMIAGVIRASEEGTKVPDSWMAFN